MSCSCRSTNYPAQGALRQILRFTKCVPEDDFQAEDSEDLELRGVWSEANWTGDGGPHLINDGIMDEVEFNISNPAFDPAYPDIEPEILYDVKHFCFFADYRSSKPGLLSLDLSIQEAEVDNDEDNPDPLQWENVTEHSFLGIWQKIYDVTLAIDESGKQLHKSLPHLFDDPNMAGKGGVALIAKVRGSFPLGNKGKKGGKTTVILPDDFGWLAQQEAIDLNRSFPGKGAAYRWDVHDDTNNTVGYITDDEDGVNPGDSFDYPLWDFLHEATLDQNRGANTNCVEYFYPDTSIGAYTPTFRTTPTGPDLAAVYADEHGVGEVTLKPGTGFYFNQLPWKRNTQKGQGL